MMWLVQVFMIAMVGVSTLLFGKQFINGLASINLNGTSMDDMEGVASQRAKQGMGLVTGVAAGAVGGVIAGGGMSAIAKGAAMGGVSGGRGARPGTAAMLGLAAGRFQGAKGRENKEAKEKYETHQRNMKEDPAYADTYQIAEDYENYQAQVKEDQAITTARPDDAQRWREWSQKTNRLVPTPIDQDTLKAFEDAGVKMREHQDTVVDSLEDYKKAIMEFRNQAVKEGKDPNQPWFKPSEHKTAEQLARENAEFGEPVLTFHPNDGTSGTGTPPPNVTVNTPAPNVTVNMPAPPVVTNEEADRVIMETFYRATGNSPSSSGSGGSGSGSGSSDDSNSNKGVAAAVISAAAAEVANATAGVQDATAELKKEQRKRPPSRPNPSHPTTPAPGTNPDAPW